MNESGENEKKNSKHLHNNESFFFFFYFEKKIDDGVGNGDGIVERRYEDSWWSK